jgi:chromatin remodeling complex protein RSC6
VAKALRGTDAAGCEPQFINVDERLNLIFPGKKKIHMFSMNKELSK